VPFAILSAAVLAALAARMLLDPVLGNSLPFVTLFGAVAAAVWAGGYKSGILAAALGYLGVHYLFLEPRHTIDFSDAATLAGVAAYAATCALIIFIGHSMRTAQQRARVAGNLLRVTLASIGEAVITTDTRGIVTFMNLHAEALTGWTCVEAAGQPVENVFRILDADTRAPVDNQALQALRDGVVVNPTQSILLLGRDGAERAIEHSAAAIEEDDRSTSGCVLVFRDITERRRCERSEAERLRSARLLASIVDSSDDAIIGKSLDGIVQSWNRGAERIFGFTAEQAIGRHISLIIPSDRVTEEADIIGSLTAGHRVEHFDTERLHSSGSTVLVSLTISPIVDEAGNVVGASKIARDVTLQRQAEERERQLLAETAQANAKFRVVFDQSGVFGTIMHVDGTVVDANRLACEGYGYSFNEVAGTPFWAAGWWRGNRECVERIKAAVERAAAGCAFRAEVSVWIADGGERILDLCIQPIRDDTGAVVFLAATGSDITERKRIEADREKFRALVENSTDFIGMWNASFHPFYINPAGLAMVGLESLEQAREKHIRDFFLPEDQGRIMEHFLPSVAERGHGEVEVRFRHFKAGEPRWMAYKVLTLTDESQRRIGYVSGPG
jgi:PAS domain S-box-containing protein